MNFDRYILDRTVRLLWRIKEKVVSSGNISVLHD